MMPPGADHAHLKRNKRQTNILVILDWPLMQNGSRLIEVIKHMLFPLFRFLILLIDVDGNPQ